MSDDFRSLFDDDEPEEKNEQPQDDDTPEWLRDVSGEEEKRPDSLGEPQWRQEFGDPFAKLDAEQGDDLLDGRRADETPQEETPADADYPGWVDTPKASEAERPDTGDYDLPPWLMGADNEADQGMFLDETGKLSEAWLQSGDQLPESAKSDITYDEWVAQQAAAQRPRDIEEEVPDLSLDAEPTGEVEGAGELPDWYLGMEKLDTSDAPEWFTGEAAPPAAPSSQPDLLGEFDLEQSITETPDWLTTPDEVDLLGEMELEQSIGEAAPAPAEDDLLPEFNLEQSMEMPDWTAEAGEEDLLGELNLEQSIADAPDWLAEIGAAEQPAADELPDWMSASGDDLALEEALEETMTGETPDWMSAPGADDLLAELDLEQSIAARQDWFAEVEPVESDQPEWLQQLGELSTAETIVPGAEEVLPAEADWLNELREVSQAQTGPLPDLDAPAFQDIDSLLASMDTGEFDLPKTGELLLDPNPEIEDVFAENMLDVSEQEKPGAPLPPDAPDWLTELGATVGKVSAAAIVRQRKDRPLEDLSERLQNLHERGEELAVPDVDEDEAHSTLAALLPGVPQVLSPARLRPGLPTLPPDVLLSQAQRDRVRLLRTLVAAEEDVQRPAAIDRTYDSPYMEGLLEEEAPAVEEAPAPAPKPRKRRRFKVDRFVISLIVAAAVILPFYVSQLRLGDLPPAGFAAGSSQQIAFDRVDALQNGDLALVAVEYGPTAAAELDSLTEALLRHIFTQGARPVLVSGNPVGLLHANNLLDGINADTRFLIRSDRTQPFLPNQDYFVVRYLAGNAVGLRGFSQNAGQYLTSDIRGQATNLAVNSLNDFALMVVVAERAEDVRAWSEQVVPLAGAPVVYATGFSAAPLAEPYVQAQTGAGLLVGYRDAYTYNALLDPSLAPPPTPTTVPTEITPEIVPTVTPIPPTATLVEPTEVPAVETTEAITPQQEAPTIEPSLVQPTVPPPTETQIQPTATEIEATNTPMPSATPRLPTVTPTQLPIITGVVDAQQRINVRQGPGTDNPVITTLEPGTEVRVLGRNSDGSWIRIQLEDGTEGWVSAELLEIQEPQSSKPGVRARVMAVRQATPTQEGEIATPVTVQDEVTAEATVEAVSSAVSSTGTPYRNERWYSMTLGIVVIVVIIALGSIVNVLRSLFGRRQR